jgi:hypothetical protein
MGPEAWCPSHASVFYWGETMHVDIEIIEGFYNSGFLFRRPKMRHCVVIHSELTEEEKYLILKLGLKNHVMFSIPYLDDEPYIKDAELRAKGTSYTVHHFLNFTTVSCWFERVLDAQDIIPKIEESFQHLKSALTRADIPPRRILRL